MIFIWGFRLFGKVDEVPGIFHVASKFFHVWYIPLFPIGSHLVLGKTARGGALAVRAPFSFKSVLLAWLRAICIVLALFCAVEAVYGLTEINSPLTSQHSQAPVPNSSAPRSQGAVGVPVSPATPNPARADARLDKFARTATVIILFVASGAFLGLAALLWKLRWLRRSSYERAMKLCEHAKLPDEARIKIERHFGRITDAEAQAALAGLAADREEMERLASEAPTPA